MRIILSRASDPPTSHQEHKVEVRANTQRWRLLAAYLDSGGITDEEAMHLSGVAERSCWWKRCSELREGGYIKPTGEVRTSTLGMERMVCVITFKGKLAMGEVKAS